MEIRSQEVSPKGCPLSILSLGCWIRIGCAFEPRCQGPRGRIRWDGLGLSQEEPCSLGIVCVSCCWIHLETWNSTAAWVDWMWDLG